MTRKEQIKEAAYEAKAKHIGYGDSVVYAFIDGAEWADAHPHWISVEDDLPPKQPNRERSKNVLVRTNSGRTQIEYYDYGNDVIKEWWKYHTTHWMPLPAPPEHFADVSKKTNSSSEIPTNLKGGEQ